MQPLKGQYTFLLQFFAYLCICNLSNGRCTRNNTSNISTVGGIRNLFSRHDNINTEKDSKGIIKISFSYSNFSVICRKTYYAYKIYHLVT